MTAFHPCIARLRFHAAILFIGALILSFTSATELRAQGPGLRITTTALATAITNKPYSFTVEGANGTKPYHWLAAGLPSGFSINPLTGEITGTATSTGTFFVSLTLTDTATPPATVSVTLTFLVVLPLSITTTSPLPAGMVGVAYSTTLLGTGGKTPYTWSVASGALPAGVTLTSGGVISGTQTAPSSSDFTVRLTDASTPAQVVTKSFTLRIAAPLTIVTSSFPLGIVGIPYPQQTLVAGGGTTPYSWSVSGMLPPGLALTAAGVLTGTPSVAGSFNFTAKVTDAAAQSATRSLTIVIADPLTITSAPTLNNGSVGVAYSVTLAASGGVAPYSWSVASGPLPPGLTLSSSGALTGTPTGAGQFNFTIQVTDTSNTTVSKTFSVTIQTGLTITTASPLPTGVVDSPYSQQLRASITSGLTWSVTSGTLPMGITLSSTGLISGTPQSVGIFDFTVRVLGGTPQQTATQPFRLQVGTGLAITTSSPLPDGTASAAYASILTATGGVAPYSWTLTGGALPDGLTLSSAGLISGTPRRTGVFTITVQASDSSNLKATKSFTISITALTLSSLSLTNVPNTMNTAQQTAFGLSISPPQANPIAGTLILSFTPNSAIPSDDPAVLFSNGSRRIDFTIPSNSTNAVFPPNALLLTGTVSGIIVVTTDIQNGPTAFPVGSVTIAPSVPKLTALAAVRTADGLKVQVTGYSPERKVTNAGFAFDVKTGTGTQRVNLVRNVEGDFDAWYKSAPSSAFGSSFIFEQLFTVQGDTSLIDSVTVTLTNGQGSAASTPVKFVAN